MGNNILGYTSMRADKKTNDLELFDKNKRYVYDLEYVLKDDWKRELYESGYNKKFVDEANGKEVDVIDQYNARIIVFNKSYSVDKSSCKEI
jgi:hypothetical protein